MDTNDKRRRADLMRLVPLVARNGQRIVEAVAERQGLHRTDVEALSCIIRAEAQGSPLTAGALGGELGLTSGATTFLMARLARAGLVERARNADDQRKVFLRLTATGRELADALYPPILQVSEDVMNAFTPVELEAVQRFLIAATEAMETYRTSLLSGQTDRRSSAVRPTP